MGIFVFRETTLGWKAMSHVAVGLSITTGKSFKKVFSRARCLDRLYLSPKPGSLQSPIHQGQMSCSLSPIWAPLHLCLTSLPWFHVLSLSSPQVCRLTLGHIAAILHWTKLKAVFAKNDVFTILSALVSQQLMHHSACARKGVSPDPLCLVPSHSS